MKAVLFVICMGWLLQASAQQDYFVLIQSEKKQPFYARLGEKNYSSSSIGHLILSHLKDSAYTIVIGFPQGSFPEQEFLVRISRKDRGYQLKNLGEKGWALFDTRTMELIPPVSNARPSSGGNAVYIKKSDDFARLMAGVVNDTAVLYTMVEEAKPAPAIVSVETKTDVAQKPAEDVSTAKKEEIAVNVPKKEEPASNVSQKEETVVIKNDPALTNKNDSVIAKKTESETVVPVKKSESEVSASEKKTTPEVTVPIKKAEPETNEPEVKKTIADPVVPKENKQDSVVAAKSVQDSIIKEPVQKPAVPAVTVINQFVTDTGYHMLVVDELKDSIRIFIPAEKEAEAPKKQEPAPQIRTEPVVDSSQIVKSSAEVKKEPASTDTAAKTKKLVMMNSDCRSHAAANDVDKLRVKLMQEKDAAARLSAAKKVFRTKCFSAQQVKGLSELFPYDDQKYLFLEAAYPFVSDTGNFKELGSLFSDPVYNQRFRKLVRLD